MHVQSAFLVERFVANIAGVRFDSGVDALVHFQIVLVFERLAADFANVGAVAVVDLLFVPL